MEMNMYMYVKHLYKLLFLGTLIILTGCNSDTYPSEIQYLLLKLHLRACPSKTNTVNGGWKNQKISEWCEKRTDNDEFIKIGRDQRWFNNGQQKLLRNFDQNGNLEGEFREWDEFGQLLTEGIYKKNEKYGKWVYWDGDGKKTKQELYEENSIKRTDYRADKIFRIEKYTRLGTEATICEKTYIKDQDDWTLDGAYKDCDKKFATIVTLGTYDKGRKIGKWQHYYPEGQNKQFGSYKGGRKVGLWKTWSPKGDVIAEEQFSDHERFPNRQKSKYYEDKKPISQRDFLLAQCKLDDVDSCDYLNDLLLDTEKNNQISADLFSEICRFDQTRDHQMSACFFLATLLFKQKQYEKADPILHYYCFNHDLACFNYGSAQFHSGKKAEGIKFLSEHIKSNMTDRKCLESKSGGDCYNMACYYSLNSLQGSPDALGHAVKYLNLAIKYEKDFDWEWAEIDPDLQPLRDVKAIENIKNNIKKPINVGYRK